MVISVISCSIDTIIIAISISIRISTVSPLAGVETETVDAYAWA